MGRVVEGSLVSMNMLTSGVKSCHVLGYRLFRRHSRDSDGLCCCVVDDYGVFVVVVVA